MISCYLFPVYPSTGNVAFLSQSGAMGLTILETCENAEYGTFFFRQRGKNRADVSYHDFLQYWEQDPATRLSCLTWSHSATRINLPG